MFEASILFGFIIIAYAVCKLCDTLFLSAKSEPSPGNTQIPTENTPRHRGDFIDNDQYYDPALRHEIGNIYNHNDS